MGKLILLLYFSFSSLFLLAQKLTVLDSKTGKALEGVIVFSERVNAITNQHGIVKLDIFNPGETIHFRHSSYLNYKADLNTLWSLNYRVKLIEDPVKLDEIVIAANRRKQSRLEVPNQVVSIDQQEIAFSNPQTAADMLETKGGIFIQKSQMGGGSPMIRGFSSNRLLLVVDGIRMNNAIYRNGNLQNVISLDAASLEHAEVIFGPGSVMYGSDALGGVLHFRTLAPKLSTSELYNQSRHFFARYSSANFEKTVHADFNLGNDKMATLASFTFTDFDDLLMGANGPDEYLRPEYVRHGQIVQNPNERKQIQSAYSQFNYLQKVRFRPNNRWDLNYAFHLSATSDIPRYDRLIEYHDDQLKYAEWFYGPQRWSMHSLEIKLTNETLLFDQLTLLTGWQEYAESRHSRKLGDHEITEREEGLDALTINLDLDKKIDQNNFIYYGFEGNYNLVNSTGKIRNTNTNISEPTSSRYPDGSETSSLAAYASYKLLIGKRFILNLGSRFSRFQMSGEFDQQYFDIPFDGFDNTHSSLTGNIGLVYRPSENWQLNATASTGFRSPNIDDAAKVFGSTPGNVVVPNPNLKPEYARNIEIGIRRSFKSRAKIELNLFYTYLDNAMVRRPFNLNGQDSILYENEMSRVEALVNADYAHIYGADCSLELILSPRWYSRHSATANFGEDSEGQPLRHVSPVFGSSHLVYDDNRLKIDLYLNFNGEISNENLASTEQEKAWLYVRDENGNPYSPDWMTLNLKSSFQLSERYQLNLGVENILNKRYRPYSSGIAAAGRNFTIAFKAVL